MGWLRDDIYIETQSSGEKISLTPVVPGRRLPSVGDGAVCWVGAVSECRCD